MPFQNYKGYDFFVEHIFFKKKSFLIKEIGLLMIDLEKGSNNNIICYKMYL